MSEPTREAMRLAEEVYEAHLTSRGVTEPLSCRRIARALDEAGVAATVAELEAVIDCQADYSLRDSAAETIGRMRNMARHALRSLRGERP